MDDTHTSHLTPFSFDLLRPRLQGIAYRMLGSVAEAEEVVQDAWLRWHGADQAELDNPEAWLVTVTTRLAIDRLRAAKQQRIHYPGFWLPEPQLDEGDIHSSPASPEQLLERADDISVAFLALLERLTPEARAAFLLREIFDAEYSEVAKALGKSETACRQIVSRAKLQLKDARPRHTVSSDQHFRLLSGFADAARRGDFAAMQALLVEDAELIGDGGGKVPSFGKVLLGGKRIAQLFLATHMRHGAVQRIEMAVINGQWSLLRFIDGELESVQAFETDGERILRLHVQRNPDKLARIAMIFANRHSDGDGNDAA
ncbi:RNA polymerase sigma-70 factor [Ottowia thiooxydans]|uniref:RNA polymerase sigma-70 factor n=1 Tax=Ottowia thiooxydans TaxID=219182 RepID=UPI0004091E25|nr:RNA polymerase sigma-70 factor [Ottowia thiooxydans]